MTINAAKILGIEDRVGSIEVGKDADFLLFSGEPLGIYETPVFVCVNGKTAVNKL